ncbi:helix-turn-helix domain-containing protein [Kineococcus arenarius]|uniref:helix-turn-helix domain-containing protein n=1 Tax=Kineococcus sp. SYSU DK020 TaxID=3383141 RepID=UPI003D7CBB54
MSALTRPRWTLTEAAQRVGVSRSTLRRRLAANAFPNAVQDASGAWTLGVEDLLGAGFTLARPVVEPTNQSTPVTPLMNQAHPAVSQAHEPGSPDLAEVARLKAELAAERARTEVERAHRLAAEQLATDRAHHIDDLRSALRMLTATPAAPPAPPAPATAPTPAPTTETAAPPPDATAGPRRRRSLLPWRR